MKLDSLFNIIFMVSTAIAAPLEFKRATGTSYDGSTIADDINNGICAPVTLIFARGSTESGTMGSTVGPALAKAVIAGSGASNVAIQGVDYPATLEGNAFLGAQGGPEMAALAQKALTQCPTTKLVLSGYSQGAMVAHYAVASANLSASDDSAMVLFGDPLDGTAIGSLATSKLKDFCASGDGVCETGGFDITAAHLSYATGPYISQGAQFIVEQTGVGSGATATGTSGNSTATSATSSASSSTASSGLSEILGHLGGSSTASSLGSLSSLLNKLEGFVGSGN